MAKMLNWNPGPAMHEIFKEGLDRVELAAQAIADDARRRLQGKVKGTWKEHPPYRTGAYAGQVWTERTHGALAKTVRVVRSRDPNNKSIWIMAGNYKTWWAVQTEFGRGGWRGGSRPFLRPAMRESEGRIRTILESGSGETKNYPGYGGRATSGASGAPARFSKSPKSYL